MKAILEYYAVLDMMTNPAEYAPLFDALPDDIPTIVEAVQGLMIHVYWAERYGMSKEELRGDETYIRRVDRMLARILEMDDRPLIEARPKERRLFGTCRDFSTLTVAILRHKGFPARARCGFGLYFIPDHYEDHWVVEYWDAAAKRWVMLDAQLDAFQREAMHIEFDTLDMPADQFWVGGRAWLSCRAGHTDPLKFGIFEMKGLWYVRGNLVRDLASLNKLEILPWDVWGLIDHGDEALSEDDFALLDEVARLTTAGDGAFEEIQSCFAVHQGLHPTEEWLLEVEDQSFSAA